MMRLRRTKRQNFSHQQSCFGYILCLRRKDRGNNGRTVMFGCFYFCEPTAVYDFCGGRHLLADNSLQKTARSASRAVWVSEGCHREKSIRSTFRPMLPLFSRVGGKAGGAVILVRSDGH